MPQGIGSALVQIMACRLFDTKPLSKLQWNFIQNTKLFVHRNSSENIVCEMAAILSRGRWVKWKKYYHASTYFSLVAVGRHFLRDKDHTNWPVTNRGEVGLECAFPSLRSLLSESIICLCPPNFSPWPHPAETNVVTDYSIDPKVTQGVRELKKGVNFFSVLLYISRGEVVGLATRPHRLS